MGQGRDEERSLRKRQLRFIAAALVVLAAVWIALLLLPQIDGVLRIVGFSAIVSECA
jgi:uncharacterized membrane protein